AAPPPQPSPARGEGENNSLPPCGGGLGWGDLSPPGKATGREPDKEDWEGELDGFGGGIGDLLEGVELAGGAGQRLEVEPGHDRGEDHGEDDAQDQDGPRRCAGGWHDGLTVPGSGA